jgi:hypothetical protein
VALVAWLGRGAPALGRLGGADGLPAGAAFMWPVGRPRLDPPKRGRFGALVAGPASRGPGVRAP